MSVEVEIYMSNLVKFFNENPNDLMSLVPIEKKQDFFDLIKKQSLKNVENGDDPSLTWKQMIDLCVELNRVEEHFIIKKEGPLIFTKFGIISLN